ncbi:transglycosylase family protein, partial [Kitasatospora sp. NPDC059577]|uniref:transglycosylase family protein n=1 Tax=Kitasatospora sp. NPDC059577 TaxID=3346873 RepID=UPI0036B9466E
MKKSTAAPVVAAFVTAALVGAAGSANAASLSTWDKVAQCESSGQWDIVDVVGGVTYYGGLQFDRGTWEAYGGTAYAPYANQATKQQQILIAEKVLAKQGEGAWPQCGPKSGLGADTADPYPGTVLHYSQTAAADFTGDGKADIVARDDSTGNLMMWVHNAGASYSAPKVVSGGWNFSGTTVGDFNGDGKADIVAKGTDGNLDMWYGNGDGTFGAPHKVTGGWDFTQTAAADFDGDGKVDLIAKGSDGNLRMWPGNGDGTFGAPHVQTGGWDYTETRAADF